MIYPNFLKSKPLQKQIQVSPIKGLIQNTSSIIYKESKKSAQAETLMNPDQSFIPIELPIIQMGQKQLYSARVYYAESLTAEHVLQRFVNYVMYDKLLGQGSYSKVYLGQCRRTRKLVAIKEVQKLEDNQISCLTNSESKYIIKLYDFWTINKYSYIALDLCDCNLRDIMLQITDHEKLEYFDQIVKGIDYLYRKNIIHRDLKFENILIKQNTVKISDFGLAKPIGSKLSVLSEKCGTPYTMAPEILFHKGRSRPVYSYKCDIYSLGVILHELLYNKHPFQYSQQMMASNRRVNIQRKYGYLDILIDRSLQIEVIKRCNWNQFLHIFSLHRINEGSIDWLANQINYQSQQIGSKKQQVLHKKTKNQKYSILDPFGKRKRQCDQIQKQNKKENQKWRNNIYQTPKKGKPSKQQSCDYQRQINGQSSIQKQNPFSQIQLCPRSQQVKSVYIEPHIHKYLRRKLQSEQWKFEHDEIYEQRNQKPNPVESETISLAKLILLLLFALMVITLTVRHQ